MTDRPRLPRSSLSPPSAENGFDAGRRIFSSCDFSAASRHTSFVVDQERILRVRRQAWAPNGHRGFVRKAGIDEFAHHERHAAGGMELIHVRLAVRIHAREQRRDARDVRHVVPGNGEADGTRHRHQVNDVVGGTAGRHEADDGVDERTLVDDLDERKVVSAQRGGLRDALRGGDRERVAQRRVRRDEGGARNMQAHHLHEHLVGVGGAVERAGAGVVVRAHFRREQLVTRGQALRVALAHFGLGLVGHAARHRAARHEDDGHLAERGRADEQARHDLVADA